MQFSCFLEKANSSQAAGFWGHSSLDLYPDSSTYWVGYWTSNPYLLISLRGSPASEASCEDEWDNRDLEKMFEHLYSQLLPVFTSFALSLLSSSHLSLTVPWALHGSKHAVCERKNWRSTGGENSHQTRRRIPCGRERNNMWGRKGGRWREGRASTLFWIECLEKLE